jgi:hypothetical protein
MKEGRKQERNQLENGLSKNFTLPNVLIIYLIGVGGTSEQHLPLWRKWAGHMKRNYKCPSALALYRS